MTGSILKIILSKIKMQSMAVKNARQPQMRNLQLLPRTLTEKKMKKKQLYMTQRCSLEAGFHVEARKLVVCGGAGARRPSADTSGTGLRLYYST